MKPTIFIYLPVIHQGYINFIKENPSKQIFILDQSMIDFIDIEFDYLRKEIRALTPQQACIGLKAIFPNKKIDLISFEEFEKITNTTNQNFILPKEDIFIWLSKTYLSKNIIELHPTFLRWNRNNVIQQREIKDIKNISFKKLPKQLIKTANQKKDLSSDWWRRVSAVLIKNGKIILSSHNRHLPSEYSPYINSDPRNCSNKGENIDISTAIHAEASLISQAAKNGICLQKTQMYVTTFPCPTCAKLIAFSGIEKLYFTEGYSMVDGQKIISGAGIEIIKVK